LRAPQIANYDRAGDRTAFHDASHRLACEWAHLAFPFEMPNDTDAMAVEQREKIEKQPWAIRAAAWVGQSIGQWQKRRATLRDEEFVRQWQRAWVSGRDSRWGGVPEDAVSYRRAVQRQAWLAGWQWANTQPDRRNAKRSDRRAQPREPASRRATGSAAADSSAISDPGSSAS
jgi:hypothetical protein